MRRALAFRGGELPPHGLGGGAVPRSLPAREARAALPARRLPWLAPLAVTHGRHFPGRRKGGDKFKPVRSSGHRVTSAWHRVALRRQGPEQHRSAGHRITG